MTVIQSELTSHLISPQEKQLQTIDGFIEEGYQLLCISDAGREVYPKLRNNAYFISSAELTEKYSSPGMDEVFELVPKLGIQTAKSIFQLNRLVLTDMHLIPEPMDVYPMGFILPLNSPFYDLINTVSFRVFEGGLMQYMTIKIHTITQIRHFMYAIETGNIKEDNAKSITLSELHIPFLILFVGNGLALFVFMLEIFFKKCKKM